MKKVSNRKYIFRKIVDALGIAFLLAVLLSLWQLYRGPISAPFLKPYIIQALNYEEGSTVSLDSVNIELVRSLRPLKIIAKNVRYENNDNSVSIEAPNVSLSFSIKALLRGMIAPSRIVVDQPKLYVFMTYGIDEENKNEANKKKVEFYIEQFEEFVERFNSEDKIYPESYINDIVINNAEVEFHEVDLGRKWSFSDLNYRFSRNFTNMELDINTLVNLQDRIASFGINGKYKPSVNKLAIETYVSEAYFSDLLSNILPEEINKKMYNLDVPVNAHIEGLIDVAKILKNRQSIADIIDNAIENISFNIEGGDGVVKFSDDEKMDYPVNNFMLSGEISGGFDKISIEDANFDIDNEKLKVSFELEGLKKYFLEKSLKDMKIILKTDIETFPLDKLSVYWPRYIAEPAWEWCKESIYGGMAKNAGFVFLFGYDKQTDKFGFASLDGKVDIEDSNIDYLGDLPEVKNFYGEAKFSNNGIYIKVDKGVADGVLLDDGFVHLYDLNKEHNMIKIRLVGTSTIKQALDFINHEPLMLANEIGLPADKIKGDVDANIMLNFELKKDIEPKDIKIEVTADLLNIKIDNVMDNKALTSDKLELVVDNKGVKIFGDAKFDGVPLVVLMNEVFANREYKSRYEINFKLDEEVRKKLGMDMALLGSDYIGGYADMKAVLTVDKNDKAYLEVGADLQNAEIDYDFLGFVKPLREDASIYAKLQMKDNRVYNVPEFRLSKNNFSLSGSIKTDETSGNVSVIDIDKIKGDKMNSTAKIEFAEEPQKITVNVSGYSYDLTTFFDKKDKREKQQAQDEENEHAEDDDIENVPNIDIFIAVSNLWTNPDVPLKNFTGSALLRNGVGVHELHMAGNYAGNQDIKMKLDYAPKPNGEYMLSIDSNNAGTTLKVLRLYDYMRGGTLKIEARRDLNKEFFGHAQIRNFNIHDAPVAAKVFTVASFTGMLNLLLGDGLAFSHFDAPFEYRNKTLYVNNAHAFGNVLGVSGSGTLNRSKERLDARGMIAPAYSLNTFLGKIPLVGNLLSGKDGTVFAANYQVEGKLDDLDVKINPLSAIPPNSIKELFGRAIDE